MFSIRQLKLFPFLWRAATHNYRPYLKFSYLVHIINRIFQFAFLPKIDFRYSERTTPRIERGKEVSTKLLRSRQIRCFSLVTISTKPTTYPWIIYPCYRLPVCRGSWRIMFATQQINVINNVLKFVFVNVLFVHNEWLDKSFFSLLSFNVVINMF